MSALKNIPILKKMVDFFSAIIIIIILSALVGLLLAFPVMWLWNFVFMNITILHINVFQAWALTVLTGILFGNKNNSSKEK